MPRYLAPLLQIPHLDFDALDAGRNSPATHTPEQKKGYALAKEITDEMVNCKHLVIASPMYNWGPPSAIKAYVMWRKYQPTVICVILVSRLFFGLFFSFACVFLLYRVVCNCSCVLFRQLD